MGCVSSKEVVGQPNYFQRNLCLHRKEPVLQVYRIIDHLGKGAFGVVEKVEHIQSQRLYAMKTITIGGHKRSEFGKEIDILRGLHHPNIVRMLETFEDDRHFYIIMELAASGTLLETVKIRGQAYDEEYTREVIRKLTSVIQYLHFRFICHRDLKLENILLEDVDQIDSEIKLCDFGASTLFKMGVSMRKILGSVVYMAPEVLEGNYTHSCDLWSLGVIMFMLLSNKAPFFGSTEDELVENILQANYSFSDEVWFNVSPEAKALIKKLLNPDSTSRYSATQVLNHPWIRSETHRVKIQVYDVFVPRLKAFCQYSAFHRAALVAVAFCMPSGRTRQHCEVYNELNVAHNGILTLDEMQKAVTLKRYSLDIENLFQSLDQQRVNGVNLLEFVAATLSPEDISNDLFTRRAFELFDRDNSKSLTDHDLLGLLGPHFDKATCKEMIRRTDADHDGKVSYDDFTNMLQTPMSCLQRTRRKMRRSHSTGSQLNFSKIEIEVLKSTEETPQSPESFTDQRRYSIPIKLG
uniref:non-specific serine/threonine protein kinase n=1 Tax=Albugo laibachii Nc14 TaxID=890382 RepID=F0WEG2_9STRA|nr:calciumdependent protein kinase putative [Albugo laibachii Nc14]|eukprot:CCA19594.1 calciumdependent protein kinase putative [Albugo laibachii Nc14]